MSRDSKVYLEDILIHQYFSVDIEIVWDIVATKAVDLDTSVRNLIDCLNEQDSD